MREPGGMYSVSVTIGTKGNEGNLALLGGKADRCIQSGRLICRVIPMYSLPSILVDIFDVDDARSSKIGVRWCNTDRKHPFETSAAGRAFVLRVLTCWL